MVCRVWIGANFFGGLRNCFGFWRLAGFGRGLLACDILEIFYIFATFLVVVVLKQRSATPCLECYQGHERRYLRGDTLEDISLYIPDFCLNLIRI